jgi:hypothetical protein
VREDASAGEPLHVRLVPLHDHRQPERGCGRLGLVPGRGSRDGQVPDAAGLLEDRAAGLEHDWIADLVRRFADLGGARTDHRRRWRHPGSGPVLEEKDLVDASLDRLGRRKADSYQLLEPPPVARDGQQRGVAPGEQRGVVTTLRDPLERRDEHRRVALWARHHQPLVARA